MDLRTILDRYAKTHRHRAAGGLNALAGFDFQLRQYIAGVAEALAGGREVGMMEALSDMAQPSPAGELVCLQVKRTLDRSRLVDAAAEAFAIDTFMAQEQPELQDKLRFGVVAERGRALPWSTLHDDPVAGAFIKRMDVAGRLLAPRLDPNPDTRTLRALWPVLNDPYAFLDRALNRALGIGLGAQAGVDLRDDLLRIFTELRGKSQGQRPMPGEWLDTASFARKSELSTHYEVGSRITLPRYRDEQYMPRPQIVDPLHRDWLAPLRDVRMPRDKIDVFWLQGRSGAGKSALLLQLLERLAGDGLRILWLGDNDAALESVLHLYHRDCLSARDALPDVIAIDDLHAPGKRAGNHVPELARWIDQQGPQQWPVLLTCGPDDLASDFDRDCAGEGFILHATTVPLVDAAEAGRLRTWYEDRFATPAPTTDTAFDQADAQGEGLLVSMAVELREGNLQSFARRFSDRIRRGGLEVALRLPLALNRLYLSAPQDWLDREARERLDALNRNEDFRLASDEAADIRTLRLTHPHLAEAVYRALRDPAVGRAYSHDLDEAFQRAMREQRPDLAFGLVRQCAWPEGAMAQRVADLDLESLAGWPAACVAWLEAHDSHPLWGRFWKDIYTHADTMRLPLPDPQGKASLLALASAWLQIPGHLLRRDGPYVLRIALASFATGHVPAGLHDACLTWLRNAECQCGTNWAFVYQALLDHAPTDAELLDLGKGWLKHDGNYTRDEWSFVYQALLDHAPTDAELLHLGGQWLRHDGNHTRDDWSFVYRALLDRIHEDAELLGLGRQWLKHGDNYTNDGWSFVYRALLDRVPEDAWLLDLGRHWLERNDNHTRNDWGFVYQILLKSAPEDAGLLDLGRHWLGRHDNFAHAGWSHVWETLHKRMPGAADLLDLGRQWVTREGSDLREDWNYVWRTLLATASDDPDLHDLGRQWLKREGNNARNDWAFVYQALLTRAPDDAELLDIGRQWLKHDGHDARDDWSFVYRSLLDRSPGDAELLDVGRRWLKRDGNDARDAWNFVYQALLNRTPDDAELLDLGRQWLKREGNGARDDWAFVYQALLGRASDDAELLDIGRQWLKRDGNDARDAWNFVYQALLGRAPDDTELLEVGQQWLKRDGHDMRDDWDFVYQSLLRRAPDDPELLDVGRRWLKRAGNDARDGWAFVYQALLNRTPDDAELLDLGRQWLKREGNGARDAWNFVYHALLDRAHDDAELLEVGQQWLKRDGHDMRDDWDFVYQSLLRRAPDDPELLDAGRRWLKRAGNDARDGWSYIYLALLDRAPNDGELLDVGRQWLERDGNDARDDWAFVYETLLGLAPGDEALLDLGFAWLAAEYREYHASWEIVWKIWMQVSLSSRQYVLLRTKALTMGSQGQGRIVVGGEYVGQVNAHAPFGLFVMLGARSGLLHRNEFPVGHNLGKDHPVGSTLRVQVIRNSFDPTSGKARLNFSYVMP